jgi:hypothetical protein
LQNPSPGLGAIPCLSEVKAFAHKAASVAVAATSCRDGTINPFSLNFLYKEILQEQPDFRALHLLFTISL